MSPATWSAGRGLPGSPVSGPQHTDPVQGSFYVTYMLYTPTYQSYTYIQGSFYISFFSYIFQHTPTHSLQGNI